MDDAFYESRLKKFLSDNDIKAEHIVFQQTVHTVADAARAVGTTPDSFIKSVVFISGGKTLVGIVTGDTRASSSRLMKHTGISGLVVATPEQVLERTGYPVGGVPPFGYDARFFMDPGVLEKDQVYGGGGSSRSLTRISPREILRINGAKITRVRK
jgi:Cys-tRNA(Pro)/Cys-tRNA(Cys) deacylase